MPQRFPTSRRVQTYLVQHQPDRQTHSRNRLRLPSVSARLFKANGAAEVIATNLGNWVSSEPIPDGIQFICGDVCDIADNTLTPESFDIVYGVAVPEHIPDLSRLASVVKRLLKPTGVAYLQGCPLWPSSLGHHVWLSRHAIKHIDPASPAAGDADMEAAYSFADDKINPIPNWARLTLSSEGLNALLVARGTPKPHADAIADYVYDPNHGHVGSRSNYKSASDIISTLQTYFDVDVERTEYIDQSSEFYRAARTKYSDSDLTTLGLRLKLRNTLGFALDAGDAIPTVSIIIPFYGVEQYIEACLTSVLEQNFQDFEVILVDDASLDKSRQIAEQIAATDDRIRIVAHAKNRGLGPSRNTGVGAACGEYFSFSTLRPARRSRYARHTGHRREEDRLRSGNRQQRKLCRMDVSPPSIASMMSGTMASLDRFKARDAYIGAMYVPGGSYLPMRAWGTLISRQYYRGSTTIFRLGSTKICRTRRSCMPARMVYTTRE